MIKNAYTAPSLELIDLDESLNLLVAFSADFEIEDFEDGDNLDTI